MRIIAGEHRGTRIFAPKGLDTRPTSDRVRENIFNLVGPVDEAAVLDLFAGSGATGSSAVTRRGVCSFRRERRRRAAIDRNRLGSEAPGSGSRTSCRRSPPTPGRMTSSSAIRPTAIRSSIDGALPGEARPDGLVVYETGAREELKSRASRAYVPHVRLARLTLFEH
jgi:16S rRNA (guanine966-N2)-methyltransferase